MIKYYVRTTLERVLDESYNQVEYELLVDKDHKPVESFIKQLELISTDDAILLEDDCVLCKDFKNRIEKVISEFPDKVINFFQLPHDKYFKTHESTIFIQNQCTYYPKGLSKKLASEMKKIYKTNKLPYDLLESEALKNMGLTHIQYRPCLVQHLDFKSLIGNRDNRRITPFFIDYLDKCNFDYNNISKMHYGKLLKEMKNHIDIKREEWLKNQNKVGGNDD